MASKVIIAKQPRNQNLFHLFIPNCKSFGKRRFCSIIAHRLVIRYSCVCGVLCCNAKLFVLVLWHFCVSQLNHCCITLSPMPRSWTRSIGTAKFVRVFEHHCSYSDSCVVFYLPVSYCLIIIACKHALIVIANLRVLRREW